MIAAKNSHVTNGASRHALTPLEAQHSIRRLKRLAKAMDTAFRIPFTNRRIGFDSLIGLVPGIGDLATTTVSAYIVREAMKFGVSKRTVARMVTNIVIDMVLGSVPLIGDLFDFSFKSNTKNVKLLEDELPDLRDTPSELLNPDCHDPNEAPRKPFWHEI